jgi:MYXO-CTERM domain-containing protein
VKDALPADKAEALDGATQADESGALVSNPGAIAGALPVDEKSEVSADASNMIPLPVFKTDVESGKTALVTIAVPLAKYADRFLSDVVVLKLKTDGATERLSSASSPAGISHAEYVWTDVDGAHIPGGSRITANQLYYLSIAIKDNSPYDWDPALGSVVDPIALALVDTAGKPAEKPEEEKSDDEAASEAGSSGCDAGLGLAGLGLAVALASARRKSMNK